MANLFTSQTPASNNNSDGTPTIESSTTLVFAVSGQVTSIRFYATANTGGTWTGYLWQPTASDSSPAGTLLASQVSAAPTASTWNTITLSTPVSVTAGVAYRVAIHNDQGRYVATSSFFTSALVNGNITGIADGATVGGLVLNNGTFNIGSSAAYPGSSFNSTCYFVDVDFTPGSGPAFVPGGSQRRRLVVPRTSRGGARVSAPVPAPASVPGQPARTRLKVLRLARGRIAAPTPAQVVVVPPAYPPPSVRIRPRWLRFFRGRFAAPIPAQVVVVPPAYPPSNVRARVRGLRWFRGRSAGPVPPQVTVVPPPYAPAPMRVRLKWPRWGRGRVTAPSPAQSFLPATPHGRPRVMAVRRTRVAAPPPTQAVAPPPYVPVFARAKSRLARIMRGAARFAAWPVSTTPPVVPPRTPTVTVDVARSTTTADLTRPSVRVDL